MGSSHDVGCPFHMLSGYMKGIPWRHGMKALYGNDMRDKAKADVRGNEDQNMPRMS